MSRVPVATAFTVVAATTISAEVAALELTTTSTPGDRYFDFLCLGTLRGKEAQRGSHQGGAAESYRLTTRDCAALQTLRQVVEYMSGELRCNTQITKLHEFRFRAFLGDGASEVRLKRLVG